MVMDVGHVLKAPWPVSSSMADVPRRTLASPLPTQRREIANDLKLRSARELREALVSGTPIRGQFTSRSDAMMMEALRGLAQACKLDQAPAQGAEIMFSLAIETIPFMDADANRDLWVQPAWLGDCKPTHPLVVDTLALLAATSTDDHVGVIEAGDRLLGGPNAGFVLSNGNASYYVWGAMQFAAYRLQNPQLSQALDAKYGAKISPNVSGQVPIRLVRSLAAGERGVPGEQATAAGGR